MARLAVKTPPSSVRDDVSIMWPWGGRVSLIAVPFAANH